MSRSGKFLKDLFRILYKNFGPQKWWPAASDFEVVVGAVLTQNTAWTNVEKAILNLKKAEALNIKKILSMPKKTISKLIKPAGYFNIKALRLKALTLWIRKSSGGYFKKYSKYKTHALREQLLNIYGIGPETADSILLYAMRKKTFVVDAYTKRIFSRHGFFKEDASYDDVKTFFEKALPKSIRIYSEFHALIVRVAKEFCKKRPQCGRCPLKSDLMNIKNSRYMKNNMEFVAG